MYIHINREVRFIYLSNYKLLSFHHRSDCAPSPKMYPSLNEYSYIYLQQHINSVEHEILKIDEYINKQESF